MTFTNHFVPTAPRLPHFHINHVQLMELAVPRKGCVAKSASNIICNTKQMSTATCPKAGKNVTMPAGCRKQRILLVL